jgi:hypothetical protein
MNQIVADGTFEAEFGVVEQQFRPENVSYYVDIG